MISTADDELARLQRVAHDRSGLWTSIAFVLIGLLVFVAFFNFVAPNLGANLSDAGLIALGLVLSLVPAALWLAFFYRMDRIEPEPKQKVFSIFLIGCLVTAALLQPVLQGIFQVDAWLYNSWWTRLAGGILIVGFVEMLLVYSSVRYGIFFNPEFDERVDGVIYAVAAALGLATVVNFMYVLQHGGVDLDIGSIRMVVNALAYASFGGVLGYFIGQARFEKTPIYYLPTGLTLAAALTGFFFYLLDRTSTSGFRYNPWGDLVLAAIVAVVTLAIVFWLVARTNEETLRLAHAAAYASSPEQAAGIPSEVIEQIAGESDASAGGDTSGEDV